MPFDRARPDEQLRVDDDPVGCEIFGSVVASIGLAHAYDAWRTRPFPADTARPHGGQPLDALLVRPGPAAATLSGGVTSSWERSASSASPSSATGTCAHADDCMREYVQSAEFDRLLVAIVQQAFPPHEHEQPVAHYRGLLGAWANDQRATAGQA